MIKNIWHQTIADDLQLMFRPNVSLLGSAYYGLGLFYRLVPDSVVIDWLWDIRGAKLKVSNTIAGGATRIPAIRARF